MLEVPLQKIEIQPQQTNWIIEHPYATVAGVAAIVLLVGAFVVQGRLSVSTTQSNTTVGDINSILGPAGYAPPASPAMPQSVVQAQNNPNILQQTQSSAPYSYTPSPIVPSGSPQANPASTVTLSNYDLNALLALISTSSANEASGTTTMAQIQNAYPALPPDLVTNTVSPTTNHSKMQQDLYNYGNSIGAGIQTFETLHANEAQVLKDQMEDRTNPAKIQAVDQIGVDLQTIGHKFNAVEDVPAPAQAAHTALAASYIEIGQKLQLITQAQTSQQLLDAINTYNASADTFAKNYIAMAEIFGEYGVTFSPNDAGSAFMFSGTSGL